MASLMVPSVCSVPVSRTHLPLPPSTISSNPPCYPLFAFVRGKRLIFTSNQRYSRSSDALARCGGFRVRACFFSPNSIQPPILKEAFKIYTLDMDLKVLALSVKSIFDQEPVAFVGGMFAGLLRLDLNEEPLKEWVSRTIEAAGLSVEEIESDGVEAEETVPQQIDIE